MKSKRNILIIILISIAIILVGIILLFVVPKKKDDEKEKKTNSYKFSKEVIEIPGTKEYTNEVLSSKHCLDNICIENAKFYYRDNEGRVEYNIINTGKKKTSGLLKMVFDNQQLVVSYKDLKPNKKVKSKSEYSGMEINNKEDYKLLELTSEEKSKIIGLE